MIAASALVDGAIRAQPLHSSAAMKVPVLLVAPTATADALSKQLSRDFMVTAVDDLERARALVQLGAFSLVVATDPFRGKLSGTVEVTAGDDAIAGAVRTAAARASDADRNDVAASVLAAIPYAEYLELSRYASTRRYLVGLMRLHRGSVTDAARATGLVRESLHRLLRRHHVEAETFRDR